ncbi:MULTISPECIES: hypothetical protein [Streptomyces]|uniref:Uncharacterized protein n=1 Tax=Streptomyces tendae TaxID=1932 RepID=A0ABX5ZQI4_STRTE|nr:hypothetical protein [Streptomyces tendae]QER86574.1 hypothetical protein F3L20_12315 [Streptomyces tendae]
MEPSHVRPANPQHSDTLPHTSENYRTATIRTPEIRVEKYGNWEIEYEFTPAAGDHGNLLVVFSSVGSKYGFGNALSGVQCNVLRIRDRFDGGPSYYVARAMDFSVSDAVEELITHYREKLGLSRDTVVLAGSSKGGSAAFYYALKYGYRNIVASTPQYFIGSYSQGHGVLGAWVLGEGEPQENVDRLDAVLPELLAENTDLDRNIYLFSSTRDYQYEEHVVHFLPALRKYSNFNFFMVESTALVKHAEVTRQGLSVILSVIYALTEGTVPRFGEVQVGSGEVDEPAATEHLAELRARDTATGVLVAAQLSPEQATLTGHAFLPGVSAERGEEAGAQETKQLVLVRDDQAWVADATSVPADQLYLKYFDTHFASYKDGGFTCDARELLDSLPVGVYDVFARVTSESEDIDRRVPLVAYRTIDRRAASGGSEVILRADVKGARVVKRDLTGAGPGGTVFSLKRFAMDGARLRVHGVFFLPGRNADRATHSAYYLTLRGEESTHTVALKAIKKVDKIQPLMATGDFGSYGFGYFTAEDRDGVDLSDVPPGTYTAEIAMSTGGALFSQRAGELDVAENRSASVARRVSGRNERISTRARLRRGLRARFRRS